ncbi:hypothetical protein HMPREF1550_01265 [Actinomyces sp. oral taxon 877 str. F0543]|nr:hypothetical protein HMPREF1550_01265 [Actinomyces sp. oral taxon 877 str. F0543]
MGPGRCRRSRSPTRANLHAPPGAVAGGPGAAPPVLQGPLPL